MEQVVLVADEDGPGPRRVGGPVQPGRDAAPAGTQRSRAQPAPSVSSQPFSSNPGGGIKSFILIWCRYWYGTVPTYILPDAIGEKGGNYKKKRVLKGGNEERLEESVDLKDK